MRAGNFWQTLLLLGAYLISLHAKPPNHGIELDISWEFDSRTPEGWANATAEEMQIDFRLENGELRGVVLGPSPVVDSPIMYLQTTRRHYAVIRMMYYGSATQGQLLYKGGSAPTSSRHLDFKNSYWQQRHAVTITQSSSGTGIYSATNLIDGSPYTIWQSEKSYSEFVVFDLGDNRWITHLTVQSEGDGRSPKNCLLQSSVTAGSGPFVTVASFQLQNETTDVQTVSGFSGHARHWRLLIIDNYGAKKIAIREITLNGFDEYISMVPFALNNAGVYTNYHIPIYQSISGYLIRMRLQLTNEQVGVNLQSKTGRSSFREALSIDYVRIVRSPEVWRVRGCLEKYYDNINLLNPQYNVETVVEMINGNLPLRYFKKGQMDLQYATTYDCPLNGGIPIQIDGLNFGPVPRVFIGSSECPVTSYSRNSSDGRLETVICTLPPGSSGDRIVRVQNGVLPGLFQEVPMLAYRVAPPVPHRPVITNIGAHKVDLVWKPPGDAFDNMYVTGYKVLWFQPAFRSMVNNITLGNVTTTSIRNLQPSTEYVFAIAAIAEGAFHEKSASLPTDLYGRRNHDPNGLLGTFSSDTNSTATLLWDFDFGSFNANLTLNGSWSTFSNSLGPTGQYGSEGHFGLNIIGNAQIANCNASMACCDGYNASIGVASCGTGYTICADILSRQLAYPFVIDDITRRQVPSNVPYPDGGLPEITVLNISTLNTLTGVPQPSARCGPALRLTTSAARQSGSVWYPRKMNVREGFDVYFKFQIANPSMRCNLMDDVNTYCRSRGADGLAFVLQNVSDVALGNAGSGLGYEGIYNALAVEIDTYFNYDNLDLYENHIAVMTQGFRYNITANHSRALAMTTRIPDMTDGKHTVRIKYDPNFDESAIQHPSFQTNGFTSWFLENADYANGGEGDWGTGFGLLYVYLDDMYSPVITTPLNLESTLNLDNGRMYVGLTAATGDSNYQVHEILGWQFRSLYIDRIYYPPLIVNGEGAHECVNETECVHKPDYVHYMRTNNLWGKGADNTLPWQNGQEGFTPF